MTDLDDLMAASLNDFVEGEADKTYKENSSHSSGKSVHPSLKHKNISGKINKKMIYISLISFFVGLVLLFQIIGSFKNEEDKVDKIEVANDAMSPDFGDYRNRVFQDSESSKPLDPIDRIVNEGYNSPNYNPQKAGIPLLSQPATIAPENVSTEPVYERLSEEEIAARRSSIVYGEYNIGRQTPAESDSGSSGPGDFFIPDPSSIPISDLLASVGNPSSGSESVSVISPGQIYAEANMQEDKKGFYSEQGNETNGMFLSDNVLFSGTIIPLVLRTGINTDLPGDVEGVVDVNVYDSLTGKNLLIPQGTRLIANYNSNISYGQKRVQIAWTKLIRPDGFVMEIGNMPGTDKAGYAGGKGAVDNHIFQYLLTLGLVSMFSIFDYEVDSFLNENGNPALENLADANMSVIDKWGDEMISRTMNMQPTIKIKPGTLMNVYINTELFLPVLDGHEATQVYRRF